MNKLFDVAVKKLLVLYFVLYIFMFSCSKDQDFALNLLPESDLMNVTVVDTFTVNVKTEKFTHVVTSRRGYVFFGSYYDPVFGYTKASFVTQIAQFGYPKFSDTDSVHYTIDSVILYLKIDKATSPYGLSYTPIPVYVYEVTDTLYPYEKYYSDQNPDEFTNYKLLGQDVFVPYAGGNDSAFIVHLDTSFARRFFDSVEYYFYSEDEPFSYRFKGFYITPGDFYDAAIFKLSLQQAFDLQSLLGSYLRIYYHPDTAPDTTFFYQFGIVGQFCAHFTLIENKYDGTDVLNPQIDSVVYLQSGGTRIKIELPFLGYLKDKIIHKAELVFQLAPEEYSYSTSFPPLETIYLVAFDDNDTTQTPILIDDYYDDKIGKYNGAPLIVDKYKINITRIVQGKVLSDNNNDTSSISYYLLDYAAGEHLGRSVLTTQKNSKPLKLVIYYSDF